MPPWVLLNRVRRWQDNKTCFSPACEKTQTVKVKFALGYVPAHRKVKRPEKQGRAQEYLDA
jgi:hypothetical protein